MAGSKLKIDIRREKILEQLHTRGMLSVTELNNLFRVTPVTIRNDLDALERDGFLARVQGGAVQIPQVSGPVSREDVDDPYETQKQAIGQAVAQLVRDGDTLFINSGTTSNAVAQALKEKKDLSIVTNALQVAVLLGHIPGFRVILTGGQINSQYGFTYGADAQEQLRQYQADWAILSVEGISAVCGVTTRHAEEALIDRMMAESAKQTLVVADHRKIGRTGFNRVMASDQNVQLVTDVTADVSAIEELKTCGVQITYA